MTKYVTQLQSEKSEQRQNKPKQLWQPDYFKFLRRTKFKPTIPNKRNGNVTNRIGSSPLPFLTTMGIFDIGWIELFQVDNCPWNEMMKFQRVDGKWNINCLVELEMTSRSKMNCSFKKIVWSVNEYHPIPWHIENRKCESTLRAQYHAKRGHCSLIQTHMR